MATFVAVAELGSCTAAARQTRQSAPATSRAVALLEVRLGTSLLARTTRSVRLTEAGTAYLETCRHVLGTLEAAERVASRERAVPRGILTVTAPLAFGRLHVRPVVDAFLDRHPAMRARLWLVDRVVNLVDEGVDVAVRIGHLPDSSLVATRVGAIRRVVCASPRYLAAAKKIKKPADLAHHTVVAFSGLTAETSWSFAGRRVKVTPRLVVNGAEAAVASACEGHGVTCVLAYQAEAELRDGTLVPLLEAHEPPPVPVFVVTHASGASAKTRAFVDAAVPALKDALARSPTPIRGRRGADANERG